MCFSHAEILESMIEDVEFLSANCAAKVQPTFPDELEYYDDENSYMVQMLDRWGDRKVPNKPDIYYYQTRQQLELIREANRLLAA